MEFKVTGGVYPTMITPYRNGQIDYTAVERLVEWYWKKGCDGIFAACQSSEIMFLSPEERVKLTETVLKKARALAASDASRPPMMIVASGHVSDGFEDQVEELNAIAALKPDALILISNRMDIANTTDANWIAKKDEMMMQIYADVLGRPIDVAASSQAAALGCAVYAAVAAGIYPDVPAAAKAFAKPPVRTYIPVAEHTEIYEKIYAEYKTLSFFFARENNVMKALGNLKKETLQ